MTSNVTAASLLTCLVFTAQTGSAPMPERATRATDIPDVVVGGTSVVRVWTGQHSADGIVGAADGSLLFTEQDASRISRLDAQGRVSLLVEGTNEAGALALDTMGRIFAVERLGQNTPEPRGQVTRHTPPTRVVLASGAGDKPFQALRDLAIDRRGGLYLTDGSASRDGNSSIYYLDASGRLSLVADDVRAANGVLLSPDEKTLYVTDTPSDHLVAFDVAPDGTIGKGRSFGRLDGTGADGLAVDEGGRVYAATPIGVQIFSPQGEHLGTIPMPRPTTSLAFAGPERNTLYVVGRGHDGPGGDERWARSMYAIVMSARGPSDRAK